MRRHASFRSEKEAFFRPGLERTRMPEPFERRYCSRANAQRTLRTTIGECLLEGETRQGPVQPNLKHDDGTKW